MGEFYIKLYHNYGGTLLNWTERRSFKFQSIIERCFQNINMQSSLTYLKTEMYDTIRNGKAGMPIKYTNTSIINQV